MTIHATCVSVKGIGVLLTGAPGSGKSELALRLIDEPGHGTGSDILETQLVADDQVTLTIGPDDKLWASAPEPLKGLLEIRGIGIVKVTASEPVVTGLLVTLIPAEEIERLPSDEISQTDFFGVAVPSIMIDPAVRSAPARIRAAVLALEDGKLKTVKNLQI